MLEYADLTECLDDVRDTGLGVARNILIPTFTHDLAAELLKGGYEPVDEVTGKVHQRMARVEYRGVPWRLPSLHVLGLLTRPLIQSHFDRFPSLAHWEPMETVVQKYGRHDGIQAHRDFKRHPYAIVIFNIMGSCDFEVLESRDGPVTKLVRPHPGDLIVLRAPGFSGEVTEQDRPFHRVGGNTSSDPCRISVAFRHDLEPNNPRRQTYMRGTPQRQSH